MNIPVVEDLPAYLGFGKLDADSVMDYWTGCAADYVEGNDLAYHVELRQDKCELTEYVDGTLYSETIGKDLQHAWQLHCMGTRLSEHPRFQRLSQRITGPQRNIYLRYPNAERQFHAAYFPAGFLFSLQLPLSKTNYDVWRPIAREQYRGKNSPAHFEGVQRGLLLKRSREGTVTEQDIMIAEHTATLLNLSEAADLFYRSGVILPEKEFRLAIFEVTDTFQSSIPVYPGVPARGFVTFSVIGLEKVDLPREKIARIFDALSAKLIADHPELVQ